MIAQNLENILSELPQGVKLVAVSKTHSLGALMEAYAMGQKSFAESRAQEFAAKAVQMPQDVEWHFIGHLQTNKIKLVLPYAHIVESIDSERLLEAVNSWGERNDKIINILLELRIGMEESKYGFSEDEILAVLERAEEFPYCRFCGLMGIASNVDDEDIIGNEFTGIKALFDECRIKFSNLSDFTELSIGMSGDWRIAVKHGSTEVRIGTAIFGSR